jgi:hypothetical protein
MNEMEEFLKEYLNGYTGNPEYWDKLSEERKRQWFEHYKYGDMFITIYPNKDPFPQPPI